MRYVDVDFAKRANAEIIRVFGGTLGAVNDANLFHVLAQVVNVGEKQAGRNKIIGKAAYLLYELIYRAHAFTDGNKRTGLAVTDAFLEINGYSFAASPEELTGSALSVASGQLSERQIRLWLSKSIIGRVK